MGTTGMWRPHGDNVETTWDVGPQGCGDHVGTIWRQHGDVETMWGQHEDNVETTWGQCGDHGDVQTMWGQHEDNVETTWGPQGFGDHMGAPWRQHGDNMRTMGMWRPHGDNMRTMWRQHGDVETVRVSRGYIDHYQGRGHSTRLTAVLINIDEHLI